MIAAPNISSACYPPARFSQSGHEPKSSSFNNCAWMLQNLRTRTNVVWLYNKILDTTIFSIGTELHRNLPLSRITPAHRKSWLQRFYFITQAPAFPPLPPLPLCPSLFQCFPSSLFPLTANPCCKDFSLSLFLPLSPTAQLRAAGAVCHQTGARGGR